MLHSEPPADSTCSRTRTQLSAQVTHTWYEAKRGPKGPKQGLLQRAKAGRDVILGAAGDSLPGLLLGAGGAVALVGVCWCADVALRVSRPGGARRKSTLGGAARRRGTPGSARLRGEHAL